MEKFGVACGCASGKPDLGGMTKLGDGSRQCGTCGAVHHGTELKLKDTVRVQDDDDKKAAKL